jgi:hypothetical protein
MSSLHICRYQPHMRRLEWESVIAFWGLGGATIVKGEPGFETCFFQPEIGYLRSMEHSSNPLSVLTFNLECI